MEVTVLGESARSPDLASILMPVLAIVPLDKGDVDIAAARRTPQCLLQILLGPSPPCGGQNRMVPGGTVPPRRPIVTNLPWRCKRVVRFYNHRSTAEPWIREGENAVKWTKLSCHDFVGNKVRLQLFTLAYNLGNFLRRLALPHSVKHWSLATLCGKLIKIGAKVVAHSRDVFFQRAEVAIPRDLFTAILERIQRLCVVGSVVPS